MSFNSFFPTGRHMVNVSVIFISLFRHSRPCGGDLCATVNFWRVDYRGKSDNDGLDLPLKRRDFDFDFHFFVNHARDDHSGGRKNIAEVLLDDG